MVRSLEHARPIVNGYSGQRPAFFTSVADAVADPASVDARATLRELDVRFVVSPEPHRRRRSAGLAVCRTRNVWR